MKHMKLFYSLCVEINKYIVAFFLLLCYNLRMIIIFILRGVVLGNNGYNTRQRELVLACIRDTRGHVTVLDIVNRLEESGTHVGISTVYRHLDKLVRGGVVRKFNSGDGGSACYQMTENAGCDDCFHLKCTGCGELIHMNCEFFHGLDEHIKDHHGFTVDSGKTVLYGRCGDCSQKDCLKNEKDTD